MLVAKDKIACQAMLATAERRAHRFMHARHSQHRIQVHRNSGDIASFASTVKTMGGADRAGGKKKPLKVRVASTPKLSASDPRKLLKADVGIASNPGKKRKKTTKSTQRTRPRWLLTPKPAKNWPRRLKVAKGLLIPASRASRSLERSEGFSVWGIQGSLRRRSHGVKLLGQNRRVVTSN